MNAIVLRLTIDELESLIEAAEENGASQLTTTKFEGKGEPDCVCLLVFQDPQVLE